MVLLFFRSQSRILLRVTFLAAVVILVSKFFPTRQSASWPAVMRTQVAEVTPSHLSLFIHFTVVGGNDMKRLELGPIALLLASPLFLTGCDHNIKLDKTTQAFVNAMQNAGKECKEIRQ